MNIIVEILMLTKTICFSYIVPKAGVVVVGGDGTVLAKFISENPDNFSIKTLDILKMTGN